MQKSSISNSVFRSVEGMSSLTWSRISHPFEVLSNLYVGNKESILVSEIRIMSTLLCNFSTSESNLNLRELMLSCATINLLGFFDLMFSIFE